MMRRTLACLCALLLTALPLCACASGCNEHPTAGVTGYYGLYYESIGEAGHMVYRWGESYCNKCGAYVGITGDAYHQSEEAHSYLGDVCRRCGYNRVAGMITGEQSGASQLGPAHIRETVEALGDQVTGARAVLLATAPLRITPERAGFSFLSLERGTECAVDAVQKANDGAVWYCVSTDGLSGWVRGALLRVATDDADDLTLSSDTLTPQTLVEINISGNARAGSGIEFDIVGKVQKGEIYVVTGENRAADSRLWYEIALGDGTAWVSSGIVTLIEN